MRSIFNCVVLATSALSAAALPFAPVSSGLSARQAFLTPDVVQTRYTSVAASFQTSYSFLQTCTVEQAPIYLQQLYTQVFPLISGIDQCSCGVFRTDQNYLNSYVMILTQFQQLLTIIDSRFGSIMSTLTGIIQQFSVVFERLVNFSVVVKIDLPQIFVNNRIDYGVYDRYVNFGSIANKFNIPTNRFTFGGNGGSTTGFSGRVGDGGSVIPGRPGSTGFSGNVGNDRTVIQGKPGSRVSIASDNQGAVGNDNTQVINKPNTIGGGSTTSIGSGNQKIAGNRNTQIQSTDPNTGNTFRAGSDNQHIAGSDNTQIKAGGANTGSSTSVGSGNQSITGNNNKQIQTR